MSDDQHKSKTESCGNDGAVESLESQNQASHPSHSPLEISPKTARFPHSHSSGDEGGWKSGKPKAGFPLSHRHEFLSLNAQKPDRGRASPSAERGAPRRLNRVVVVDREK